MKDSYLGSGVKLRADIRVLGRENFEREILSIHSTLHEAYSEEAELVTWGTVMDPLCYNMVPGGAGNTQPEFVLVRGQDGKFHKTLKSDPRYISGEYVPAMKGVPKSRSCKTKLAAANRGKRYSEETRQKLSAMRKGRRTGKENPMYGKPSARRGVTLSDKTKQRISERMKGRDPWNRTNIVTSMLQEIKSFQKDNRFESFVQQDREVSRRFRISQHVAERIRRRLKPWDV